MDSPDPIRLGPFAVRAGAAEVAAFRDALGTGTREAPGDRVPLTFPIRWLASPEIQSALRAVAGDERVLLVHEAQSFRYPGRLEVDRSYALEIVLRRESGRSERAVLQAIARNETGEALAEIETVLRLADPDGRSTP